MQTALGNDAIRTKADSGRRARRRGFSLVELLVAIGIIGTLLALLLPALNAARTHARKVSCMSNLRQLAQLTHNYATENRGRLPANPDRDAVASWVDLFRLEASGRVQQCPSADAVAGPEQREPYLRPGEGGARMAWSGDWEPWVAGKTGGYGWNFAASDLRTTRARGGATIPLFADCARPSAVPVPVSLHATYPIQQYTAEGQRYLLHEGYWIDRHRGAINVAFLDQHVETVELPRVMRLQWWPAMTELE